MTHEPVTTATQCTVVVSVLNQEQGWNLGPEQQQAYVRGIEPHIVHPCTLFRLRTIVMNYHHEHTLVQALQNQSHPQHDSTWQQQMGKVIGILRHAGVGWMKDAAIDSDDLAQIALLELTAALPTYHYTSRFSTWSYSVVVQRIRRYMRDRSALKRTGTPISLDANPHIDVPVDIEHQPDTVAEGHVFADLIYTILKNQRGIRTAEIFEMWANNDAHLQQIGEHVQCSSSWIRVLLNRARTSLQQHPGIQAWLQQVDIHE